MLKNNNQQLKIIWGKLLQVQGKSLKDLPPLFHPLIIKTVSYGGILILRIVHDNKYDELNQKLFKNSNS